eukprot:11175290-Lingulodinium_polyedra.AAC.1
MANTAAAAPTTLPMPNTASSPSLARCISDNLSFFSGLKDEVCPPCLGWQSAFGTRLQDVAPIQ